MGYRTLQLQMQDKGLLVYTKSEALRWDVEKVSRDNFGIGNDAILSLDNNSKVLDVGKTIKQVRLDLKPWLVLVPELDALKINSVRTLFKDITKYNVKFILFTESIKVFKLYSDSSWFTRLAGIRCEKASYFNKHDILAVLEGRTAAMNLPVKRFILRNYGSSISTLFELRDSLRQGFVYETVNELTSVFGLGTATVNYCIVLMLKYLDLSTYKTGDRNKYERKKIDNKRSELFKYTYELLGQLTYRTFYNYVLSSLDVLIDIQLLILSGKIVKGYQIDYVGLEEDGYNINGIRSWGYQLQELDGVTMNRLLKLRQTWSSRVPQNELDLQLLLYKVIRERSVKV